MIRRAIIAVLTLATVWSVYVCFWHYAMHAGYGPVWRFDLDLGLVQVEFRVGRPFLVAWSGYLILRFPAWFPCLLFGAFPFYALLRIQERRRRRRRREQGLCVDCGYDLTGNVTGVCSECGLEIEQP